MKNLLFTIASMLFVFLITTGCRTDQSMYAWGVYSGLFAVAFAVVGIIYVITKVL
jgi:hypothetical protein